MALRRPRRAGSDDDRILPLINIVFLLLIFFMIAGQLTSQDLFEITPPETENNTEDAAREPLILIAEDGRLALGGEAIDEAALMQRLRAMAAEQRASVRLKADAQADAAGVARLLQQMKDAGVGDVRLVTAAR